MIRIDQFLCILLFIFSQTQAQESSRKYYTACDIVYENGTIINGYLKDFGSKTVELNGINDFNTIENRFEMDRDEFTYRKDFNIEPRIIKSDSIKRIVAYMGSGNDTIIYDKVFTKTINIKNEIVDLNKRVFLPLLRKGKLDFYGYSYDNLDGPFKTKMFMGYIKRPDDNFVIKTLDFNRLNLINAWSLEDRIYIAFITLTTDCEAYQNFMKEKFDKMKNNSKEYKKEQKEILKKYAATHDVSKNKNVFFTDYLRDMQIESIIEYENLCK